MAEFTDILHHADTLLTILGGVIIIVATMFTTFYKLFSKIAFTLKNDIFLMLKAMDDRLAKQEELMGSCVTWDQLEPKLDKITDKQLDLRQNVLPRDFMRKDELKAWNEGLKIGLKELSDRLDSISRRLDSIFEVKHSK